MSVDIRKGPLEDQMTTLVGLPTEFVKIPSLLLEFLKDHHGDHLIEVSVSCLCGAKMTTRHTTPAEREKWAVGLGKEDTNAE